MYVCLSWEGKFGAFWAIFHDIQWEFEAKEAAGGDVRMYRLLEIHPCVRQDIGPLGPLPKKGKRKKYGRLSG